MASSYRVKGIALLHKIVFFNNGFDSTFVMAES